MTLPKQINYKTGCHPLSYLKQLVSTNLKRKRSTSILITHLQFCQNNLPVRNEDLSTKSTSPNSFELGFVKRHNSENINRKQSSNSSLTSLNMEENKNDNKKSHFVERQGDWICTRCKNLNFSFRIVCNRCKISKSESEVLYEGHHMQNIFNLIKYNELIQNQILLAQQGAAFNINSPAFFPARNIEN